MALRNIPVDAERWPDIRFYAVEPKLGKNDEGEIVQRQDKEQRNLYQVSFSVAQILDEDGKFSGRPEQLVVTIPGEVAGQPFQIPGAGLEPYEQCRIEGMTVSPWEMEGRSGLAFRAESVGPLERTKASAKTPATPAGV